MNPPRRDQAPLPPQNLEAEEYVIGAMMLSPVAIERVIEILDPAGSDFYRESHAKMYRAALTLYARDEAVDAITLSEHLDSVGLLAEVGGKERIREIATLVPATSNVAHHARIVRDQADRRRFITTGLQLSQLGWDPENDHDARLSEAERLVFDLTQNRREATTVTPVSQVATETFAHLQDLAASDRDIVGLATGFKDIDVMMSGLRPGQLVVVAGRPSMGKTAFVLGLVAHAALRNEPPVPAVVFTLEMSKLEVMQRLLAMDTSIDTMHVQHPKRLRQEDWGRLLRTTNRYQESPLYIDEAQASTMNEIRSKARRLKLKEPGLGLIVVDYLQLMTTGGRRESRNLELGEISRAFKILAAELHLPIVVLSQLNRDVENRHDKRPNLADLRDSGAVEQDADAVIALYREEYYFPEEVDVQGIAEAIVLKHRNGPTGTRKLSFQKQYARFGDLAGEA